VTIRGERTLVKKVQAELERVVAGLRERVVLGVVIPVEKHRMLIGHGGQPLMELEKKTGAEVQFPGSRSYNQVAPAENAAELEEADPRHVVKVVGARAACEKAIAELLVSNRISTLICKMLMLLRNLSLKPLVARRGKTPANAVVALGQLPRFKSHSSTIISCVLQEISYVTSGV
jgi:hypothetical protein